MVTLFKSPSDIISNLTTLDLEIHKNDDLELNIAKTEFYNLDISVCSDDLTEVSDSEKIEALRTCCSKVTAKAKILVTGNFRFSKSSFRNNFSDR